MGKRDLSIDAFKGIAIICVVAIHSLIYDDYSIYFRKIITFAVPAFIFLSGYLSASKTILNFTEYKNFLIPRLSRVLWPYFIWSLAAFILWGNINLITIIKNLITGQAQVQFYFIILIVQFYVLMPIFPKIKFKSIITINLISILSLYMFRYMLGIDTPFPLYAIPFTMWITYFYLGVYFKANPEKLCYSKKYLLPALLISIILMFAETLITYRLSGNINWAASTVTVSSFIYSLIIILLFVNYKQIFTFKENNLLVTLGKYSFGIFLIHMFFLPQIRTYLGHFDVLYKIQPVFQLILVTTTLTVCYFIMLVSMKFLGKFNKYLGFS